jgi:hypothetical protein
MPRCAGLKRDGGQCTTIVKPPQTHCYQHDPARAAERKRNASRAAKSKPSRELARIKARLSDLADGVLEGRVNRSVGAVASQILNVYLRAISVETRVKEVEELEQRICGLEESEGEGWREGA